MKLYKHSCQDGQIYEWYTDNFTLPTKCPNGCGREWEDVDLSAYKVAPFVIGRSTKVKKEAV